MPAKIAYLLSDCFFDSFDTKNTTSTTQIEQSTRQKRKRASEPPWMYRCTSFELCSDARVMQSRPSDSVKPRPTIPQDGRQWRRRLLLLLLPGSQRQIQTLAPSPQLRRAASCPTRIFYLLPFLGCLRRVHRGTANLGLPRRLRTPGVTLVVFGKIGVYHLMLGGRLGQSREAVTFYPLLDGSSRAFLPVVSPE